MPNMGIDSLKANLSNAARVYMWDVIIPSPIGGGSGDVLMLRCQSTELPGRGFADIDVPYKQTAGIRYHGRMTYPHDWTLTFLEGEDKATFDAFYKWCQKMVSDLDGVGGNDLDIKTDMYLTMLKLGGDPWLKIKLIGCYVKDIPNTALAYNTDGILTFTVTISYDRWEVVE